MAQLHRQADAWRPPPGFVRIEWDRAAFFGDTMVYGVTPALECWKLLPPSLQDRCSAVADRLTPLLAEDPDIGLIHADLHLGNALFAGTEVKLIDFDDSGRGPRIYELAVALWERRDEDDYDLFREALTTAYTAERDIDLTHLDPFIALRQVGFLLWYTGMAGVNPSFAERLDIVNDWSHDMFDLTGMP